MNVFSMRNIILRGPDGEKFHLKKNEGTKLPAWAEKLPYLKALEKDGKVVLSDKGKRMPKKSPEPPKEPPAGEQEDISDAPAV